MTTQKMTIKSWLRKSNGKVSAMAFLQAHKDFLMTGTLAQFSEPILAKVDSGEVMPTIGLEALKSLVLSHHLAEESARLNRQNVKAEPKVKDYVATIYSADGEEVLTEGFDKLSDADRWTDRRLFAGTSDHYGVVSMTKVLSDGEPIATVVLRGDSIARILKAKKGAVMRVKPKTTSSLGFGVKAKNDHCSFSAG